MKNVPMPNTRLACFDVIGSYVYCLEMGWKPDVDQNTRICACTARGEKYVCETDGRQQNVYMGMSKQLVVKISTLVSLCQTLLNNTKERKGTYR